MFIHTIAFAIMQRPAVECSLFQWKIVSGKMAALSARNVPISQQFKPHCVAAHKGVQKGLIYPGDNGNSPLCHKPLASSLLQEASCSRSQVSLTVIDKRLNILRRTRNNMQLELTPTEQRCVHPECIRVLTFYVVIDL